MTLEIVSEKQLQLKVNFLPFSGAFNILRGQQMELLSCHGDLGPHYRKKTLTACPITSFKDKKNLSITEAIPKLMCPVISFVSHPE